ncbi:Hypothetical predicted protein [Octopus vulgaris]|uniref:NADH dehydrogenase [ubiquinone] 1 alpha subcomplex subunit 10, mitochondrial n=1 Tax=Octopus vulgaris TaxID=6645 RepID=A0AA36BXX5_OCTVU|nr:Hypothetical predicted protein [Octopus vulgaris]
MMIVVRSIGKVHAAGIGRIPPSLLPVRSPLVASTQIANLTSPTLHRQEEQKVKPWPYKERVYNQFWQFFDHTSKRFTDNSRIIVVDGNIACGKTEFAKQVAESFDLHYMPDIHPDEVWFRDNGFDMRELDDQFTQPANVSYDLKKFLSDPDPKKSLKLGRPQMLLYQLRFFNYVSALEHLLNTGQGVVMERSVYSDMVFAEVFTQLGYMRPQALQYYTNMLRKYTICDLWKPHLFIYLDAPIPYLRERINKRRIPYEVNSPVLTDDFLRRIDKVYKEKLFPSMKDHSEILTYDVSNLPDWEIIVEELEELNLHKDEENPEKFKVWRQKHEDDFNNYRMVVSMKDTLWPLFVLEPPLKAPELMIHGEDFIDYERVINGSPAAYYERGFNPEEKNVMFKL